MRTIRENASYESLRSQRLEGASTIRVFGIPLGGKSKSKHVPIRWSGIASDGLEHREQTSRIWHLPKGGIVRSGKVTGFSLDGFAVHWFDLNRDCSPVEESYSPVSLSHAARLYLTSSRPAEIIAAAETTSVPVTLDPTAGPTGTKPPTTIQPLRNPNRKPLAPQRPSRRP